MKSFMHGIVDHKGLLSILAVLVVAIIGLTAGIIINITSSDTVVLEPKEEPTEIAAIENMEQFPTMKEVNEGNYTKEEKAYYTYIHTYNNVITEANRLMEQNPQNYGQIMNLFSKNIAYQISEGQYDRAASFITAEKEILLAYGLKAEALRALTEVDYSSFVPPQQHRYYSGIVALAEELNDYDAYTKYKPLADQTKAAWDANYAASIRVEQAYGDMIESALKGGE